MRTPLDYGAMAETIWNAMDKNERHGVRYGLFPADKMRAAEEEATRLDSVPRDFSRNLSSALMSCASANGGMIA
jgi:hypothetical protein